MKKIIYLLLILNLGLLSCVDDALVRVMSVRLLLNIKRSGFL